MLTFEPTHHVYTLDGLFVWSVTQILRLVGLVNFDNVPPSILEAARARGIAVHAAICYLNEGDLDVADFRRTFPHLVGYLESWMRLLDSGRLQMVLCEHRVAHRAPNFSGTADWIGRVDDEAAILDFATGDPEDACKHLQLAAYVIASRAWAEEPGEDVLKAFVDKHAFIRRFAVQLRRDGSYPLVTAHDNPRDYTTFLTIANAVAVVDAERRRAGASDWTRHDPRV